MAESTFTKYCRYLSSFLGVFVAVKLPLTAKAQSTGILDLSTVTNSDITRFDGTQANEWAAQSVAGGFDADGDGKMDVLSGSPLAMLMEKGRADLIFGAAEGNWTSPENLGTRWSCRRVTQHKVI